MCHRELLLLGSLSIYNGSMIIHSISSTTVTEAHSALPIGRRPHRRLLLFTIKLVLNVVILALR